MNLFKTLGIDDSYCEVNYYNAGLGKVCNHSDLWVHVVWT